MSTEDTTVAPVVSQASGGGISLYIIIAIVALVVLCCCLFYCTKCCKKKKDGEDKEKDAEAQKVLLDAEGKEGGKQQVFVATTKVTESPIIKGRDRSVLEFGSEIVVNKTETSLKR